MKPALQFRLSQSLALTPQLQQAIRLLQLSRMELELELNLALETNPLLDMETGDELEAEDGESGETLDAAETQPEAEAADADEQPLDLEIDRSDYRNAPLDEDGMEPQDAAVEDLRDHLLWQLNLTPMSARDRAIAATIIEAVDDDGYLAESDETIAQALAALHVVSAEEIVPEETIRRHPDRTLIPGFAVDALVHAPYGAYPHECYGLYDAEPEHFTEYVAGIQRDGLAGVGAYLDRYVYAPASHADYLALFGEARLGDAARRARELTG